MSTSRRPAFGALLVCCVVGACVREHSLGSDQDGAVDSGADGGGGADSGADTGRDPPDVDGGDGGNDGGTACYRGGCSRSVCSDEPNVVTTCEWRPEYACYRDAVCERQSDGKCGFRSTTELQDCLDNIPVGSGDCYVGGCSGQLCTTDPDAASDCALLPEYACYADAICERQTDGMCGWTQTPELTACVDQARGPGEPCYIGGCSSQLCTEDPDAASTCEWAEEYACYRDATCARQADGACGWTQTPELTACIDDARG